MDQSYAHMFEVSTTVVFRRTAVVGAKPLFFFSCVQKKTYKKQICHTRTKVKERKIQKKRLAYRALSIYMYIYTSYTFFLGGGEVCMQERNKGVGRKHYASR